MRSILAIAQNTFKQTIRDRILYGIIVFALIFLGSTTIIGSLSLGEDPFVIKSLGLAGIYVFGLIITLFLGSSIIYDEVDKKTTYLLLSKPVTRNHIIWGKFLGLLFSIGLTLFLMTAIYLGIIKLTGGDMNYQTFLAILLQLGEMAILIGVLIMFSIFTTPLAATIYTILILYIGHVLSLMKELIAKSGPFLKAILNIAYYVFPNLEKYNVRDLVAHNLNVPIREGLVSMIYAVAYVVLALYLAQKLLNHKDL